MSDMQTFMSPRGRPVSMALRPDTNDFNTTYSCLNEDEYGFKDLHLDGWALDVGAYTGGATVALLVDNPDLRVVAMEPVPENVALIHRNLAANDLTERAVVLETAAGDGGEQHIRYGYSGSELACHHAWVGNMSLITDPGPETPHILRKMQSVTLASLLKDYPFSFVKIDCEGCEWDFLRKAQRLSVIRGEWHPTRGHTQADFAALLAKTHNVTFSGPLEGPGGFEAVAK